MPRSRVLHALDIALAVWVVVWIGLGIAIGVKLADLTGLSQTVVKEGQAVQSVGRTLGPVGSIPLVGGGLGHTARQIEQAGASAVASGRSSTGSIEALSWLLAIAVALLPSVPVFGFYLPARIDRLREARALEADVRAHGEDPAFQAFLAHRAIEGLGYHRLRGVSATPWLDLDGASRMLAAAELQRLGLDPALLGVAEQSGI